MTKKNDTLSAPRQPRDESAQPASNIVSLKASRHVADRVTSPDIATLNTNELKSIQALLAYVAHQQKVRQSTVASIVENRFGVDQVEKLKTKDYEEVVRFLVDLNVELMTN